MTIPAAARDLVIAFEGYHRRAADGGAVPYRCPAGVWTIGYGSIWLPEHGLAGLRAGNPGRKTPVTAATPGIDRAVAGDLLAWELDACERAVDRLIRRPLPALSRGALVSFTYNLGAGSLAGSTLRRVVEAGDWSRIPNEFGKWRMAGGVVLAGLVRRRAAEAAMFLRGIHDNDNDAPLARGGTDARRHADRGWAARVFPAARYGAAAGQVGDRGHRPLPEHGDRAA